MTAVATSLTGASSSKATWDSINWDTVKAEVRRLQTRIAKAISEGRHGKVKSLQWLLTHSFHARLLAVKRVVQNRGGKTPGIDKIIWQTPLQKMEAARSLTRRGYQTQPLRRIYIPKKDGRQRPLSIPTMKCRAMQALHLLALDPIAEFYADKNSYGFRPKRSTADAIEACVKSFLAGIREIIKSNPTVKTENLIHLLNPKIRGWTNYHRFSCAKRTFSYVDHCIFTALWRWVHRRHSRKSASWLKKKYFRSHGLRNWNFLARTSGEGNKSQYVNLFRASSVAIKRHIKIKAEATPYDPRFTEYFEKRAHYLTTTRAKSKQTPTTKYAPNETR